MKGKNEEIIIAHHLDKLWMLPYFGTFSVFVNFSLLKKNCPRTLSMTGGPWTPGPCFFLSPIILVIITLILFRVNRWGECGRGKTITQFFSISFNRNEMLRCIFETWLFRRFQELSFNSIFYCSYSRNYLILTSNSLPADVLWGSFVTYSFFPTDRREEMNSWRTKPKERLRGLLTSKSDFLTFIPRLLVNWD